MVRRHLRQLTGSRGFSLADLIVAMAIMATVTALAWPWFSGFLQATRVKAGAQELSTIINGARQLAIARNTLVCVTLTSNSAVYRTGVSAACAGGAVFVGALTKADGTIPLTNSMQISGTTANVVFTNLGAASTAGTYTVRDPATNKTMQVVVAASGRVTIQ
jgi:Tfp pilus assembly protein FimT